MKSLVQTLATCLEKTQNPRPCRPLRANPDVLTLSHQRPAKDISIRVHPFPFVVKLRSFPEALVFGLSPLVLAICFLFSTGCAMGPNYHRPSVNAPETFRGGTESATNSLADLPWWQVFHDETLQNLIFTALTNNYDLRIAITRVAQEQALAAQARSEYFPQVNYEVFAGKGRNVSANLPSPTGAGGSVFGGDFNASWEIDLWGNLRRLNESARAQYVASQEAQRDITISLIAEVAQDYFQLLALDRQLAIARDSTNSFGQSLEIFNERLSGGVASRLETSSAEALMDSAAATIPELEQQVALQEDQLSVLLGQNPGAILRGSISLEQQEPLQIPAGLPSALLERRPDIREAEQQLRSANALVGVAKADFFPQLNLTGLFGTVSPQLSAFTSGGDVAWSVAAGLTGPLFHGGQLRAQYAQAKAIRDQYALQYQAAVLNALQEVSDALISRQKSADSGIQASNAVIAYKEAVKVSLERYRLGNSSYYEVLEQQQLLFPAEDSLVQIRLNQLLAVVQLYRSLGGGWQPKENSHP
jgi:multidrug efflux system outer membrane protein